MTGPGWTAAWLGDWVGSWPGDLTVLDLLAVVVLLVSWLAIDWRIEHPASRRPSVSLLMEGYRREWMTHMVARNARMFDAQLLGILRQGPSFFASATMIAIGGGLALMGNTKPLTNVAENLSLGAPPPVVWEIKMLLVLGFLANSFLKYVWSHRLFGYCSVIMAAVPNDADAAQSMPRAQQAAELNITAARSFNRGLRATYFALASAAWLLGPLPLIGAALLTVGILWRREFNSSSRSVLLRNPPGPAAVDAAQVFTATSAKRS